MAENLHNSQIITLSIPKVQANFIKEQEIKPSKILQKAIADLMSQSVEVVALKNQLQSYKQLMSKEFTYFGDFLASKNIDWAEFAQFKHTRGKDGINKLVQG